MKRASRLTILALPAAAALVLPSMAWAADGGTTNTLRATIGGDGSVKSVTSLAGSGASTPYTGDLPLTLGISRSVQGGSSTYTYHVENTFSKTQDVSYTDTQGVKHTASTTVQLPLVAQLGVTLPKSFTSVSAPSAVVTTDPDGTNHVLWNLVLFSPLGSPAQDLTFTATGSGTPTTELVATAVNPATTSGLSQAQQDATASSQQDDFWQGYASGGNGGLTQLASGTAAMIAGLKKLSAGAHTLTDGLKTAEAGANKLDAGTKSAYTGSKKLSAGIGQIHTGQAALTSGLAKIKAGLAALDDKSPGKGVQAAVDGLKLIEAGAAQLAVGMHGVGGTSASPTIIPANPATGADASLSILLGLKHPAGALGASDPGGLIDGITTVKTLLAPLATGLDCAVVVLNDIRTGTGAAPGNGRAGSADPCYTAIGGVVPPMAATTDGTAVALLGAMTSTSSATSLFAGAAGVHLVTDNPGSTENPGGGALFKILFGLDHAPGTLTPALPPTDVNYDKGGLYQIMQSVSDGADQIDGGLLALLDPTTGLPAAVTGIDLLTAGAGSALTGSTQLTAGSGDALSGSKDLAGGLGQLSAGQHQVATGLPAAVDGAGQIAGGIDQVLDGANKVEGGIVAVRTGAVAPLNTQLIQGSQNAKRQAAVVEAAAALASQAPGGAGTSYVLTQFNPKLAAATSSSKTGSSHTGAYVGVGLGGFAALVIAVVAGFAMGRRSQLAAAA
jgi:putative membrane protein